MPTSPPHGLCFDEFTLDTVRCVLLRGTVERPLRRQSFEVLRYLAEHAGKIVSSDEIVEALWSAKPADQNASVGQCIKEIRQAIGQDARWIIKTISGRGYEFMAKVAPFVSERPGEGSSIPLTQAVGARPAIGTIRAAASVGELPTALVSERTFWRPNRLPGVAV